MEYVFDTETNGLLPTVSVIHCAVIRNVETDEVLRFRPLEIQACINFLNALGPDDVLIAHNGIAYDLPVIEHVMPGALHLRCRLEDTLVLSRLAWSDRKERDFRLFRKGTLPGQLIGRHSLESWGYRLGVLKGDYGKQEDAWEVFTEDMLEYCAQDTLVTALLWKALKKKDLDPRSVTLEYAVADLCARMERNGFPFDERAAAELYARLAARRQELSEKLSAMFAPWYRGGAVKTTKRTARRQVEELGEDPKAKLKKRADGTRYRPYRTAEYVEGTRFTPVKLTHFNASSRDHVADRLMRLYGWVPEEFTEDGKPKVDDEVLGKLPYPPAKVLAESFMVDKRLGQLSEGKQAWLRCVRDTGRIHGSITPTGTITHRAAHSYPNMGQVPATKSPYGHECRALFTVPPGWYLLGADASGLELRCLAHYMAKFDGGAYIALVLGDVHTANQKAAGLPTRDNAKTFIYAFLYGAGDRKLGRIVAPEASAAEQERIGKKLKRQFLKGFPALAELKKQVAAAAKRGYIKGPDGRRIPVRSPHAALNSLLQSAGAVICKKWIALLEARLQAEGFRHGWDGDYVLCAWVHDEVQIACRTREIAERIGALAVECVEVAGKELGIRCPLTGEFKIGRNWAETH